MGENIKIKIRIKMEIKHWMKKKTSDGKLIYYTTWKKYNLFIKFLITSQDKGKFKWFLTH